VELKQSKVMLYTYYTILVLSSLAGLFFLKKSSPAIRLLIFVICYSCVNEIFVHLKVISQETRYLAYMIYASITIPSYLTIFSLLINNKWRYLKIGASLYFLIVLIYNWIFVLNANIPSVVITLTHPVLLMFSLILFYEILNSRMDMKLAQRSSFWFNVFFMVYTCISYTHLAFFDELKAINFPMRLSSQIQLCASMLYYFLLIIPIALDAKHKEA
jgi:hypothetical protein